MEQIPHKENTIVDELPKLDLNDLKGNTDIIIEYMGRLGIETKPKILFINLLDWRILIISYLKEKTSPSSDPQSTKLRVKAFRYILIDDILYKKSFTFSYLCYLGQDEVDYVLREIYEGIYGQHLGGRALAQKAFK